jgi:Sulfotransferase family
MTMPNFLIIGAAKCGTDSLYSYLAQHPQIYMSSNKEPMFFVAEGRGDIPYCGTKDRWTIEYWDCWVNALDRYHALFDGVSNEIAIGEASTWYIYDEQAPARICHHVPEVKLIAVLRNPVDRAYSAYTMLRRDGREQIRDFSSALGAENERIASGWEPMWHYRSMGFYFKQLERYYHAFDPAQIRVVLYDDFSAQPHEIVRSLFGFLGVDDGFEVDVSERHNVSLVPRNSTYHNLIAGPSPLKAALKYVVPGNLRYRVKTRLLADNFVKPAPLPLDVRRQLMDAFRPDILQLQELIGRDLSGWLRPIPSGGT